MALEKQATRYVVDTDLIINHLRKAADLAAILNPLAKDDAAFLVSSVNAKHFRKIPDVVLYKF